MEQEYKYMVCTVCSTFNHAPYIVDAMNGFTMQETTFPVYYLITDDASTDGEPEVIKRYLADHFQTPYRIEETDDYNLICANHNTNPNCTFVVFLLKYNHYSIKKSKLPYQSEWRDNAKYIASCEGDDYWIHPKKLQMQVEYMEDHHNCGLAMGGCRIYSQSSNTFMDVTQKTHITFTDILIHGGIGTATCTIMYRTISAEGFNALRQDKEWRMGDFPLFLYLSQKWDFHDFDETMSVYRVLLESASHSSSYIKNRDFEESIYDIQIFFAKKMAPHLEERIRHNTYQRRFMLALKYNQKEDMKKYLLKLPLKNFKYYIIFLKYMFKDFLKR